MTEEERQRRLQAYALQNFTGPLKVQNVPQAPKVQVTEAPQKYKVSVGPSVSILPKNQPLKVSTPYSVRNFFSSQNEKKPDTRAWGTKLFDTLNPLDNGRSWATPGKQVAPNWAQRNLSPTGIYNIGKEIVQGTARVPIELGQTVEQIYRIAQENERRKKTGLPQLGTTEADEFIKSKTYTPSGWQKRLFGDSKVESYIPQGKELSGVIEQYTGKKPSPLLVTGGLIATSGPMAGSGNKFKNAAKKIAKTKDVEEVIRIAEKKGVKLDKDTASLLAINQDERIAEDILIKRAEDTVAPNANISLPESPIAKPTSSAEQVVKQAPTIQPKPSITDDLANNIAINKNPTEIREAVNVLLPNIDETTKTDLVSTLARAEDPEEVKRILDAAQARQAEITKTVETATPQPVPAQTIDQAVQEATTPVAPQNLTEAPQQAVPTETTTPSPAGVANATDATNVPNSVDPLEALKAEARKYKSAEEFVKAQGEPVYHGTTEKINGDFNYPLYTTPKKDYAQVFADSTAASSIGKSGKKLNDAPMVHEFAVNPKARVLDITNPAHRKLLEEQYFGKYSMSYDPTVGKNGHIDWAEGENLAEWVDETNQPFDAIKLDEGGGGIDPSSGLPVIDKGVSYLALNKNALKSKSELTDLYNQATQPPAPVQKPTELPKNQAESVVPGAQNVSETRPAGEIINEMKEATQTVKDQNGKSIWEKIKHFFKENWDPRYLSRESDKLKSKNLGRELLPSESLEDAIAYSQNYADRANLEFSNNQSFINVASKYKTDQQRADFIIYAAAKHDLERLDNGLPARTGKSKEELAAIVQQQEQLYPDIEADLFDLSQNYVNKLYNDATYGEDAFIPEDLTNKVTTQKDGSKYKYYIPLNKQMPDNNVKPMININNIGSISEQGIIKELEAPGGELELNFRALEDLALSVKKKEGQARVARLTQEAIDNNALPGGKMIKTAEQDIAIKERRTELKNLRDYIGSVKKQLSKERRKVARFGKAVKKAEDRVVSTAKDRIRNEHKKTATDLRNELGKAKVNLKVQKAKLGLPKYKKAQAEGAATQRARQELANSIEDPDAKAAVSSLTKEDLLEVFDALANDAPIPKNTRNILMKLVKTEKQYNKLVDDIDGTTASINETKEQLIKTTGMVKESAQKVRNMSKEELLEFYDNVINNGHATPQEQLNYKRYMNKRSDLRDVVDDYEGMVNDLEVLETQKHIVEQDGILIDSRTGKQVITGIDNKGNQFFMEVTPDVYKILMGVGGKEGAKTVRKIGGALQAPFRMMFTGVFNPAFQIFQAIVNPISLAWNSDLPITKLFTPSSIKAGFSAFDNNAEFQKILTENSASRYSSDFHKLVQDRASDAIAANSTLAGRVKWFANPRRFWGAINELGGKIDNYYRTVAAKAAYDDAIKNGLTESEARKLAGRVHRTILPEYANVSGAIATLDRTVAMYAAASQAGARTTLRAYKNHPIRNTAYIAAAIAPVATVVTYNMSNESGKAYYEDMIKNGKTADLDNNVTLVMPGAKPDDKGRWSNVWKFPIPPEFRGINKAAWRTIYDLQKEHDAESAGGAGMYARSLYDFLTGGANAKNPAFQTALGVVTGKDVYTGDDVRDSDVGVWSRQSAEYVLRNLGSFGKGVQAGIKQEYTDEGEPIEKGAGERALIAGKTYLGAVPNRFYGSQGSTSGSRYFKSVEDSINSVGLSKEELNAYYSMIAPPTKDRTGKPIKDKTYYDSSGKAIAYQKYPKLFEVDRRVDAEKRANGEPGDPIFDLKPRELQIILNMQANYSPGNYEDKAIKKLNPWINEFNKKRSAYFDQVRPGSSDKDPMGMTIPKASDELQAKIEKSKGLKGNDKRQFYADNPEITDFLNQLNDYQRAKREFLALPQFDNYPTPTPEVQKLMDDYSKLPKGNGPVSKTTGKATSPDRNAWIKTHPEEWKKISDQYNKFAIFNAQEEGALAVYEGIDMEQETLDKLIGEQKGGNSGYGRFGYAPKKDETPSLDLSTLLSGVKPSSIQQSSVIDTTPKKLKFKVKVPSSSKGKRLRLQ